MRRLQPKKVRIKHLPTAAVRGCFTLLFESNTFSRKLLYFAFQLAYYRYFTTGVEYFYVAFVTLRSSPYVSMLVNINPAVENTCQSVERVDNPPHVFHLANRASSALGPLIGNLY